MGSLTYANIVQESTELAGNTGLTVRAYVWLSLILRELLEKFPAPVAFAAGEAGTPPDTPLTLTTGASSLQIEAGSGQSHEDLVMRSVRRVWICVNGQTDFSELPVEHMSTVVNPPAQYTGVVNLARGRPSRCIVIGGGGAIFLYFDRAADKTYAVWFTGEGYPESATLDLASKSSTKNIYPNDLTVVQGVYAMCLKHQADERFATEWAEFRRMASEDRARWMNASGANTRLRLSPRSFRPRSSRRNPWDWMGPK